MINAKAACPAIFLALTTVGFFTSCKKDDAAPAAPLSAVQVKDFTADPAINSNHYAFFSLERNEPVALADSATAKWDIAIRSTTILTNGGTSGPGKGGAFVQKAAAFNSYAAVSKDSVFRTDNAGTSAFAIPTGSGNGWYNYDFTTNVISPIPGNLLIIRTASGNYAKVEILSYYKNAPATPSSADVARYYTFRFIYQSNGSLNF